MGQNFLHNEEAIEIRKTVINHLMIFSSSSESVY